MAATIIVFLMVILVLISILCLAAIFMPNPYQGKPREKLYPSVSQIKAKNAAIKAKREIEMERGKILAFSRKPYYKSSQKKPKA